MCKLFAITGKTNQSTARQVLYAVNNKYEKTQKNGFGFVAVGPDNLAYGRYIDPETYAGFKTKLPKFLRGKADEDGELPTFTTHLIAHGRTSTNHVCPENVHPFRAGNVFLAHNGMVDWDGPKDKEPKAANGCDSEQLLNWLLDGGQWHEAGKAFTGWGAVMLLDAATRLMMIAVDSVRLYAAKRHYGSGWVFATDDDDLIWICKQAKIQLATRPIKLPRRLVYFDPSGELCADEDWDGFGTKNWQGNMGYCGAGAYSDTVGVKKGKKGGQVTTYHNGVPHWERGCNAEGNAI